MRDLPRTTLMPWGESMAELGQAARAADEAGVAGLWSAELQRSATITASVLAANSEHAVVGTGIAWAFCRTPMTTALEAMDLDEQSQGRFVLGLGSGVRRLVESWHGAEFDHPVERLEETVEVIRAVIAGAPDEEEIEAGGELVSTSIRGWDRGHTQPRRAIPVYLAAVGPKMCDLAGRVADGWLGHELGSPEYLDQVVLPRIREGLEASGRDRSDIDLVASGCCVIDEDGPAARRRAAGLVAFYATVKTYADFFAFHGFGDEAAAIREAFRSGDTAAMIAAVPDEMVAALTFAGTPDEVEEKRAAYAGLVDGLKLSPPTHLVCTEVTREAQASILDHLGRAA
ncbi:LLM class flavin-dependent oxidoreductase [Euzebya tangerina]|uniref:LLM class flavin-dependent oxidoreductase n=1 Tax=Euzebya tangerina TaxID=591198 RepID=UPI00196AA995|nr:LLM class flavin-dependent oxidoreductase [Euzebya tangerina]